LGFCINTAIQFYTPNLTPIGQNIRLSRYTWDPQQQQIVARVALP
jgi:hypothetical protein